MLEYCICALFCCILLHSLLFASWDRILFVFGYYMENGVRKKKKKASEREWERESINKYIIIVFQQHLNKKKTAHPNLNIKGYFFIAMYQNVKYEIK